MAKGNYKHRDISWLSFNERVLLEAANPETPLLERLRFLAIFSSNLDEFFRVRISQLRQLKKIDKKLRKKLLSKTSKLLRKILNTVHLQQIYFGSILEGIYRDLRDHRIYFHDAVSVSPEQKEYLLGIFANSIEKDCPVIGDLSSEQLEDGAIYLLVHHRENEFSLLPIPTKKHGRFIRLPGDGFHYIFLDDVIRTSLFRLFPDQPVLGSYSIKLSRDAELYLEDETDDIELVEKIYASLKQRSTGQPTRLLYDAAIPEPLLKSLKKVLQIKRIDLFPGGTYHNYSDYSGFQPEDPSSDLLYETMEPLPHPELSGNRDFFEAIAQKDRSIHFPYQQFKALEDFFRLAANDPGVKSIKISLYRIAKSSALTDALMTAIENQKKVTIFVEAKARFDEENNILWGKALEAKGAQVVFSVPNIKVHAKIAMVEREERSGLKRYAFIGTGNFNRKTAKIYCDHGIFTADSRITDDLHQVFLVLEKRLIIPRLKYLLVSPYSTRTTFMELIENEIANCNSGKVAGITLKMNSLEDPGMIDALCKAHAAGVPVRMLIRGFCCLNQECTGGPSMTITSIIDRYLEHGRLYLFENNGNQKMFLGSADWMTRNLDKRIEVLTPILDAHIFAELSYILQLQLKDNVKARVIDAEDTNSKVIAEDGIRQNRSQYQIYDYIKKMPGPESEPINAENL